MNRLEPNKPTEKEHNMADHKQGEMNIEVQEKTFEGFMSMVSKGAIVIVVGLILLAMING